MTEQTGTEIAGCIFCAFGHWPRAERCDTRSCDNHGPYHGVHGPNASRDCTCAYCQQPVTDYGDDVPAVDDDEEWESRAEEHTTDCEWIATRAHRIADLS